MGNGSPFEYTAHVLQAQGMVSVQAGCGLDQALIKMTDMAGAYDRTIDDIAEHVLDRLVRFDQ